MLSCRLKKQTSKQNVADTNFKVHKMFKYACIISLFLFKGEKRKRSHIGNISNYLWEKENCLNELENMDDSEIINFSNLTVRFKLRNVSGI